MYKNASTPIYTHTLVPQKHTRLSYTDIGRYKHQGCKYLTKFVTLLLFYEAPKFQ